jgi:hypothetical protein
MNKKQYQNKTLFMLFLLQTMILINASIHVFNAEWWDLLLTIGLGLMLLPTKENIIFYEKTLFTSYLTFNKNLKIMHLFALFVILLSSTLKWME